METAEAHGMCERQRALRRDAQRNRELLLAAAGEAFAVHGLGVPLEDIARRAGVGIATLYRRFPTREDLIDAVFADRLDIMLDAAARALTYDDAWAGFVWYVEQLCEHAAVDRGFNQLMGVCLPGATAVEEAQAKLAELVDQLIARAHVHGALRADFTATDLAYIRWAQHTIGVATRDVAPQAWRRYLGFILDACRADAATPLPEPPLTAEQLSAAMRALGRGGCPEPGPRQAEDGDCDGQADADCCG